MEDDMTKIQQKMYEAQAIVIEKETKIEGLEREKKELEDLVRNLQQKKPAEPSSNNGEVWAAIKEMQERQDKTDRFYKACFDTLGGNMRYIQERLHAMDVRQVVEFKRLAESMVYMQNEAVLAERQNKAEFKSLKESMVNTKKETVLAETENKKKIDILLTEFKSLKESMENQIRTRETHPKPVKIEEKLEQVAERKQENQETILLMGGSQDDQSLDDILILDWKSSSWKKLSLKLPCKNRNGGSVCLNEIIYIFGGNLLGKRSLKLARQKDWVELTRMNEARREISNSSLAFQGCIWVFGGSNGNTVLNSVEKYNPERNQWSRMPPLGEARTFCAAAVYNGKIFVCGGYQGKFWLSSAECFDHVSGIWSPFPSMPEPRCGHSLIFDGNNLLAVGGTFSTTAFNTVWKVPEEKDATWRELKPMNAGNSFATTATIGNVAFLIGGNNTREDLRSVIPFARRNLANNCSAPQLPTARSRMSSVVVSSTLGDQLKCQLS